MQYCKSVHVGAMIFVILVDTHTYRQTDRQLVASYTHILLGQSAELRQITENVIFFS